MDRFGISSGSRVAGTSDELDMEARRRRNQE